MKRVALVLAVILAHGVARAQQPGVSAPYPAPTPYPPPYPPYSQYPQYPYPQYPAYGYREPARTLPYSDGQTIPPGYRLVEGPRRGMVLGGALSIGIPYLIGVPFAADAKFTNGSGFLLIPGIGPWITLATRNRNCGDSSCQDLDHTVRAFLILDGMAQSAGLALIAAGYAWPSQKLVRLDVAGFDVSPVPLGSGFGALMHRSF